MVASVLSSLSDALSDNLELTTPFTAVHSVREGAYLLRRGLSPYASPVCRHPILLLRLIDEPVGGGGTSALSYIETLLSLLPFGLAMADRDGRVLFVNKAFARAAGISRAAVATLAPAAAGAAIVSLVASATAFASAAAFAPAAAAMTPPSVSPAAFSMSAAMKRFASSFGISNPSWAINSCTVSLVTKT